MNIYFPFVHYNFSQQAAKQNLPQIWMQILNVQKYLVYLNKLIYFQRNYFEEIIKDMW